MSTAAPLHADLVKQRLEMIHDVCRSLDRLNDADRGGFSSPRVGGYGGLRHSGPHGAVDGSPSAPQVGAAERRCCRRGCCRCRGVGKPWDWR